jgi:hypothetical protein
LSALSIFAGISSVVGPVLGNSYALRKTLPAIGTIAVYELSLFGVLCALVVRWRVMRDAVSLVALVGIFLVTLGMLVSTVANDNPEAVAVVGVVASALALAQLNALRRFVGVPLTMPMSAALALMLLWNCLNASGLAWYIDQDTVSHARTLWPISASVPIAAVALLYVAALTTRTGALAEQLRGREFLRAPGMAWAFAAVLIAGTALHQYATRYVFDLPFYTVDYVPLVGLAVFTGIEVLRGYARSDAEPRIALGTIPLVALAMALASESYDTAAGLGAGLLGDGAVVFGCVALLAIVSAARSQNRELKLIAAAHVLALIVLALPQRSAADGVEHINWTLIRGGLAAAVGATLLIYRVPALWLAALIAGVLWLPASEDFQELTGYDELSDWRQMAALAAVYGLGTVVIALIFGEKCPLFITGTGATGIALAGFSYVPAATAAQTGSIAAALVLCGALFFWRTRDWLAPGILSTSLAFAAYRALEHAQGWRYMLLGFFLLAVGAAWSVWNNTRAPTTPTKPAQGCGHGRATTLLTVRGLSDSLTIWLNIPKPSWTTPSRRWPTPRAALSSSG